jgi:phosphoketolase
MVATPNTTNAATPAFKDDFREGIQYFGEPLEGFDELGRIPVLSPDQSGVTDPRDRASVFQTLLAADALRYLTLQITGSKASGHPGGFASSAEAVAAFYMLGHKNMPTEVGHHAPGYYSAMFLDRSLEDMGIHTVAQMRDRYREKHGLLGHLSGYIPGILAPAGPLGQGQHFAMAGALLHRDKLFPVTIGDGGLGEPYPISSIAHFHTAYPEVTNFVPILVWNGYSQEHHSMVSTKTNAEMIAFWKGNGFDEVILVDAKDFDDQNQTGAYVDSTAFSLKQRLAFTEAVLVGADQSAKLAFGGKLTVFIIKQLKGAGVHARGAKSHNLYAHHTLDNPDVVGGLKSRALNPEAWQTVSTNLQWAGGGSSSKTAVTESAIPLTDLGTKRKLPQPQWDV